MAKRILITGGETIFTWRMFWGPVSAAFYGLIAFIILAFIAGAINHLSGDQFFTWLFGPLEKM